MRIIQPLKVSWQENSPRPLLNSPTFGGRERFSSPYNPRVDDIANAADAESGSGLLGGLGRLDVRRDGLVQLRARPRARTRRVAAALGHRRHSCQHRLLRQRALRVVPLGLWFLHA